MKRGIVWGSVIVAASALVVAVAFVSRFGVDPQLSPSPLIGKPVPDVTVYRVPDGEPIALGELGGEILVVNFWAPWCVPCRAEHAELTAVAEAFGSAGVRLLGIAYESREAHIVEFLDELGWSYEVALDDRSRAAIGFGIRGVPETFFVDRDGLVVAKVTGPVDYTIVALTLERIILGEPVESVRTGEVQPAP